MADCNETLRELQIYLDGELTSDVKYVVDEHLLECVDCMQTFDFHAELRIVIATKCKTEAMPAALLEKIVACFGLDPDEIGASDLEIGDPGRRA